MTTYAVKFYKGNYSARQAAANEDRAICYVEHHFNACGDPDTNYSVVIVATNASNTSISWGLLVGC